MTASGQSSGVLVITALPAASPPGDLVAPELDRIVERHDRRDDAERLAHGDRQRLLAAGDGVERHGAAEDALGLLGIAAEDARGDADLAGRLADALAVLAAEQHSERRLVRLDAPRHRLEDLEAPPCAGIAAIARLAMLRGGDGALDIGAPWPAARWRSRRRWPG